MMRKAILWLVLLGVSVIAAPSAAEIMYDIIDLGTLGGNLSVALGVNDSGQVVGHSRVDGNPAMHAFLYDDGVMTDLGTLGGSESAASAINDSGQVVGYSDIEGSSPSHAFLYDGGVMNDLGSLGGTHSSAEGINNSGQVVGYSLIPGSVGGGWIPGVPIEHAFLYDGTEMIDLGTLGGLSSSATSINDNGQAVGHSKTEGNYATHAFLYDGTEMIDIGTLGSNSYAKDINNNGYVVGGSYLEGGYNEHAFLYDGTEMIDLGTLGGLSSSARGINDSGQVVGSCYYLEDIAYRAFLYDGGEMLVLNDLINSNSGWDIGYAYDINSSGQIVGRGYINGENHAFLMTPIPEPTNSPPVADAGDDQIIYLCADGAAQVELDGSGSTDADGDELDYLWTWEIEGTLFDANGVSPIIELPVGLHTINLTVDDGVEESEPNSCVIEVIEGIEVDLRVMPRVINRKSRMTRILAVVQLPAGIDADDIDGSFWLYPGEIEPHFSRLMTVNSTQKLFMVFDKSELMAAVPGNGAVVLEIEAQLISGRCLYGSDRIRIIRRGRGPREQTGLRKGTRSRRNRVKKSR